MSHTRAQGHTSNVFDVRWATGNTQLYSAGNDGQILRYDVEGGSSPVGRYLHDDAVHKISLQPENSDVFVSASHDFTLKLWDARASDRAQVAFWP